MKTKPLQILFTEKEMAGLEKIRNRLGLRFKSEVVRYLIKQNEDT